MTVRKVIVIGANGKMGRTIVKGILGSGEYELSGAVGRNSGIGEDVGLINGLGPCGILLSGDLEAVLSASEPDAAIEFSTPNSVMGNTERCLARGIPMVIGTTGLSDADYDRIKELSEKSGVNVIIAPNFSIGAVLMMVFAQTAGKYFKHIEIIEQHNCKKLDCPSGTALKTAKMILSTPEQAETTLGNGIDHNPLGAVVDGIHIHSIRLPGFAAIQEVICGDIGQLLTIKHETLSGDCYIPGLFLALRKLPEIKGVVYGLETLL